MQASVSPIYCEKCEEPMEHMGESFLEEKRKYPWQPQTASRRWFSIWRCPKCHGYKDIPKEHH